MKFYFTFGYGHRHELGGVVYDRNCVVLIRAKDSPTARDRMFSLFGDKWAFEYIDTLPDMKFFPRGVFDLTEE